MGVIDDHFGGYEAYYEHQQSRLYGGYGSYYDGGGSDDGASDGGYESDGGCDYYSMFKSQRDTTYDTHVTQTAAISAAFCLTASDLAKLSHMTKANPRHPSLAPMKLFAKSALKV